MVQCPSCKTAIEVDFGMVNCPNCSAMFMVEMDGTVKEAGAEFEEEALASDSSPYESEEAASSAVEDALEAVPYDESETSAESPSGSNWESPEDEIIAENSLGMSGDGFAEELEAPAYEEDSSSEPTEIAHSQASEEEMAASDDENFMDAFMDPGSVQEKEADGEDPLGVTSFSQSKVSQMTEGMYYYDVKISGLDSSEIRHALISALTDSRFDWLADDLKKKISGGVLILNNLNPVKAVLVVIKLQHLDVEVDWEQKLFTDESVQEGEAEV